MVIDYWIWSSLKNYVPSEEPWTFCSRPYEYDALHNFWDKSISDSIKVSCINKLFLASNTNPFQLLQYYCMIQASEAIRVVRKLTIVLLM